MKNKRGPSLRGFIQFLEIGKMFKEFCIGVYEESIDDQSGVECLGWAFGTLFVLNCILDISVAITFSIHFVVFVLSWLLIFAVTTLETCYLMYLGKFYSEHENE